MPRYDTEQIKEYLRTDLTPDDIDKLKTYELPDTDEEVINAAVEAERSRVNAEWETRYRETFFGTNTREDPTPETQVETEEVETTGVVQYDDLFKEE